MATGTGEYSLPASCDAFLQSVMKHGSTSRTDGFEDLAVVQRALAVVMLASMDIAQPEQDAPDIASHCYEPHKRASTSSAI